MGTPAVNCVTEWMMSLAKATTKGSGIPEHRLLVLPKEIEKISREEVIAVADRLFDEAVAALTTKAFVHVPKKQS